MPWTLEDYPVSMRHLSEVTRAKAIDIANALLAEGMEEGRAYASGQPLLTGAVDQCSGVDRQRCGSNSVMRLAGCVGSRASTSLR